MSSEPIGMNFEYVKSEAKNHYLKHKTPLPSSYAILWCMTAMGVYRIFNRDEMREFLFRLAITFHSTNLVETWFLKDHLMEYSVGDGKYTLKTEDIIKHFGFECINSYDNISDRNHFFSTLSNGIFGAAFISSLEGFSVLGVRKDEEGKLVVTGEELAPAEITEKMITNAEFFADDLMKLIPDEIFQNKSDEMLQKEIELKKRKEKIDNLPAFDINKVPQDIILKCAKAMYIEEYAVQAVNDTELYEKDIVPFIYLGWLYHNGLMERRSDGWLEPVEGVPFDFNDYELEDGGWNLDVTLSDHEIEDMKPYLEGLKM
ncbi:MAG: hypothetical protein ACOCYO_10860 [Bacteroidota bacterium]